MGLVRLKKFEEFERRLRRLENISGCNANDISKKHYQRWIREQLKAVVFELLNDFEKGGMDYGRRSKSNGRVWREC